jgi:predicted nucleotidyltransferase
MREKTIEEGVACALGSICLRHDVSIIYACESGSRAWGFASKDSDYDVRFVYASHKDWYLSVDSCSKRDVIDGIEIDWDDEKLDIAGWDLRKALGLFHKGNPPFLEWLNSPIVYVNRFNLASQLRALAEEHLNKTSIVMHYVHMAFSNWKRYLKMDLSDVLIKKYLYVVRPLCAAIYLADTEHRLLYELPLVPPVEFESLLGYVTLPPFVKEEILKLINAKRAGEELGVGPRVPVLDEWISALEAEWGSSALGGAVAVVPIEELNNLFRNTLEVIV